jgi:signal transduction histidine kinase
VAEHRRPEIDEALRDIATQSSATAVALYETGRTFKNDREYSGWTGSVYLVAGWPIAESRTRVIDGFPASLPSGTCDALWKAICTEDAQLIRRNDDVSVIFDGPAVDRTAAAIAVKTVWQERFSSIALLYYQTHDDAARSLAEYTRGPNGQTPLAELQRLSDTLEPMAKLRHYGLISTLQSKHAQTLEEASIDQQLLSFEQSVAESISELAEELRCPDVRVYMIRTIADLVDLAMGRRRSGSPAVPDRLRYELKWKSWPVAPELYITDADVGPLGWVLRNKRLLGIHDRLVFQNFNRQMEISYPGLQSMESYHQPSDQSPKISLLDVSVPIPLFEFVRPLFVQPIILGSEVIGLIVCNGRYGAPYAFHHWDETSLAIFGLTIGAHWLNLAYKQRSERNLRLVERASGELRALALKLSDRLVRDELTEDEIYKEALCAADRIIDIEPFSSIRRYHETEHRYRYAHFGGDIWKEPAIQATKMMVYDVSDGPAETSASVAEYIYRTKRAASVEVASPPKYFFNSFPDRYKFAVYSPIFTQGEPSRVLGMIDIRSITAPLPDLAPDILEILSLQISLFIDILYARRGGAIVTGVSDHEVLSPLRTAIVDISEARMQIARGMIGLADLTLSTAAAKITRARRTFASGGLSRELLKTGVITNRPQRIVSLRWLQTSITTLVDEQKLLNQYLGLSLEFDAESVNAYKGEIIGNEFLLEQMILNLLENAEKYSRPNTAVTIRGLRIVEEEAFALEFMNYGRSIDEDERTKIRERGYRGRKGGIIAGQGVGLWLVDAIVASFHGHLEIEIASNERAPHVFRLVFPKRRAEG